MKQKHITMQACRHRIPHPNRLAGVAGVGAVRFARHPRGRTPGFPTAWHQAWCESTSHDIRSELASPDAARSEIHLPLHSHPNGFAPKTNAPLMPRGSERMSLPTWIYGSLCDENNVKRKRLTGPLYRCQWAHQLGKIGKRGPPDGL